MPLAVALYAASMLLHPQRMNEPVPDGLGKHGIA
jgi:hypothetical protein